MEKKKPENKLNTLRFYVKTQGVNYLLHGKSPKYEERFKSWARNTQGEHLTNLADALLSATAKGMVTGQIDALTPNVSVEFLRGQTNGILMFLDIIKEYASETLPDQDQVNEDYQSLADSLD